MGYSTYSTNERSIRSQSMGYKTKSREEIFTQSRTHETMNPNGVKFRECRDSESHPNATPIQFYLDVTGSMGDIPHILIKEGLPHIMSSLIESGVKDASLMFGAIGDHKCDSAPLQVAQFESGDAELDMFLTRTYLEGRGGGNGGESYLLAWYFASNHVKIDSFEKRKQKGFVFTIGDEPCHNELPCNAIKGIMGNTAVCEATMTREQLLASAQKENHVFHIFITHGTRECDSAWKELMGNNLIMLDDYTKLSKVISDTILAVASKEGTHTVINSGKTAISTSLHGETPML